MNIPQEKISHLLSVAKNHSHAAILLSNNYEDAYGKYELMGGFGANHIHHSPESLNEEVELAFGHISYQFKNKLYRQFENKKAELTWPEFQFFEPLHWLKIYRNGVEEQSEGFPHIAKENDSIQSSKEAVVEWNASLSEAEYLILVDEIRDKICNGEFYEMNFCTQFTTNCNVDPYTLFLKLNESAKSPFAAFYKMNEHYLICASPERFLVKKGQKLISQPIKGTLKRRHGHELEDRQALFGSEKDKAENVMIVDLVRNDLSQISEVGSVTVRELCEIYTFSHVHQMISTVESTLREQCNFSEILEALFPMGSMTGAPKIEVMKNIDNLERFCRQLYSGSIGYWEKGDFDLNVVIRSLEYHSGALSFGVGGAITFDSDAKMEYEECLTKAVVLLALFKSAKE
jgi:para-aminobenzoate synthetase component 1